MKRINKVIGQFDKYITIQAQSRTSDGAGGWSNTYSDLHTLWADIIPATGTEALQQEQLLGKKPYTITARYSSELAGIDNQNRVKWGTRFFNIHSVINLNEEGEFVEMLAFEE